MNLATFERAQVAAFAYKEARYTGSPDCLKTICYALRNRLRAGWGNGSWLAVLESACDVSGNEDKGPADDPYLFSANDRLLQLILRDVDDIYLGQDRLGDSTQAVVCGDNPPKTAALYYMFVDREPRAWFAENIVRKPQEHPHVGNVGPIMLFR